MFNSIGAKFAGGMMFGSISGALMAALLFNRIWAPVEYLNDHEKLGIMLYYLMAGSFYGFFYGVYLAFSKTPVKSMIGCYALFLLGVFTLPIITRMITRSELPFDPLVGLVFAILLLLGQFLGRAFVPEFWKKRNIDDIRQLK